jgi:hypothetical protein
MDEPDAEPRAEYSAGVSPAHPLLPPQGLLIALALMAALHFLRPATERNGSPWRWAGLLPAAMGLTLVLHSARLFDRMRTTIVPFHRASALAVTPRAHRTRPQPRQAAQRSNPAAMPAKRASTVPRSSGCVKM